MFRAADSTAIAVAPPRRQWRTAVDLPPTVELLADGGDARLALDPVRGTNKYGCRPFPDPDVLAFGSSTASIISEPGFAAAEQLREALLRAAPAEPAHVTYARELQRLRGDLIRVCGLAELPGTEIIFAASGTDLHLIAAQLAAGDGAGLRAIAVEPTETGSGVPAGLAGRHFSTSTPLGQSAVDGMALAGAESVEVVAVPGRNVEGALRPSDEVAADVAAQALEALDAGQRALVIVTDVSKTGMLSPSVDCALELQHRLYGSIDVLVDACQFRLAQTTLRAYLKHGFMVAVTGSKFVTGPAFCGALLIPPRLARRLRTAGLPSGLTAYSARGEWPGDWPAAERLPEMANYGLLLRWQAALTELEGFAAMPEERIAGFVAEFGLAVQTRFATDGHFEAVVAPMLDRRAVSAAATWDRLPTIFPFLLRRPGPGSTYMRRAETERVYKQLAGLHCQVGQPVACGARAGVPVSVLRLCLSARLIVDAVGRSRADAVIEDALSVLDKAARVVDEL